MTRPRMPDWFNESVSKRIKDIGKEAVLSWLNLENRGDGFTTGQKKVEQDGKGMSYAYKGTEPITSLEQAIEFFEIDLDVWEVERYVCNSWDVSSNTEAGWTKTTNYQVKVWLRPNIAQGSFDYRLIQGVDYSKPQEHAQQHSTELVLVIGCVHRPFHHQSLWGALMRFIADHKKELTGLVINGDYLDLLTLSSHSKGQVVPDGLTLQKEYEDGYQGITDLAKAFGAEWKRISKHFLFGNHEDRYFRYVKQQENALLGKALLSPVEALRLLENGFEVITDYQDGYLDLSGIHVFHGYRFNTTPSKRTLEDVRFNSCIFNHTHRFGSYSDGVHSAHNIGWLGDKNNKAFKYKSRHQRDFWQNGFALVEYNEKSHCVHPVKLGNGFFALGDYYTLQ